MATPDVRPVGDLPDAIGKTAARVLQLEGVDSLAKVSLHTERQLLALHGVGPKVIRLLREALVAKGLNFRQE
ncbi:MAG: hypothetical protein ACTHWM_05165 [Yaniella sp.]|uniref:hypothetical protein n=1 Tax=Yaniella sp. TaxID=2773929 RepID=UPI003F9C3536